MKCHWCYKSLQIYDSNPDSGLTIQACPDEHVRITTMNLEVIGYVIIWDVDLRARDRYRLRYNGDCTTLSKQDKINNSYYSTPYTVIVSIDKKIDLIIENDIIQGERMINSIEKLKAFA